ncbi:MAG: hypothetical protein WA622_27020 [Mycobacterium sp.]|uniref:hypothetical protein n=1 Tax=Mycobacterium sp. TaxID=1785 RepID=UPI003C824D6F
MTLANTAQPATSQARTDAALEELFNKTGIDLSPLPPVIAPERLAPEIGVTVGALAQDRYRNQGIPYIKLGRRVRYARADVARYLMANRRATVAG